MLAVLVEGDILFQLMEFSVHADAGIALAAQLLEQPSVFALPPSNDRSKDLDLPPFTQVKHPIDDLLGGLGGDRAATLVAMGFSDVGKQQPQIVVDLGDRPHSGAGVVAAPLLVDGDRRGESLDEVHLGLVHLAEELASVRGEGFHITALALGVDRIEGQGRLARAGEAGDDDQLVARQLQVDVFQIMLPGALDDYLIHDRETPEGFYQMEEQG